MTKNKKTLITFILPHIAHYQSAGRTARGLHLQYVSLSEN